MIKLTNLDNRPVYILEQITAVIEYTEMTVVYTATNEFEVKETFDQIFHNKPTHLFN